MFYIYVIKSTTRQYIYKGMTHDVQRRLLEHNNGLNRTTKPYRPFAVVLVEEFNSKRAAAAREKYLKTGFGRTFLANQERRPLARRACPKAKHSAAGPAFGTNEKPDSIKDRVFLFRLSCRVFRY